MIRPEQVFLAVEPVDMRMGVDGLSTLIQEALKMPPCDGSAYGFVNRSHTRLKLLVWDGSGVWLCHRRLHQGKFVWPTAADPVWRITPDEWRWLISGVDWRRLSAPAPAHWKL